jgi:HYR domain
MTRAQRSRLHESIGRRSAQRRWAIPVILAAGLTAVVAVGGNNWPARAATNRFVSVGGSDTSNDCSNAGSPCATIQHAVNQSASGDTIHVAAGTYVENVRVSQNVTIQGDAFNATTVNGNAADSVFTVNDAIGATLSMLTITNGDVTAVFPGQGGGGIANFGTLTVVQSTINGNKATPLVNISQGGGILNHGTLTVINSTISGNQAINGVGGGIYNNQSATATFVNTTINGNSADRAGGIFNSGDTSGGKPGTLNLTNTIIAGSTGGDCLNDTSSDLPGVIATNSHNLIQDGSCNPAVSGDPKLGPLQNNGGPTFTHALMGGSPALDAGDDSVLGPPLFLTTDQRGSGFPRKSGSHVDIGAFELQLCTLTCPANITKSNDPNQCGAVVNYPPPTTNGDVSCGTVTCSPASGSFFPVGTTTVSCDASGTTANPDCTFTVTVNDTQPPTITCPGSITSVAAASCPIQTSTPPVNFTVTAADNCPGVTVVCKNQSGAVVTSGQPFPIGTTTVTCTATDTSGNTASCGFTVSGFSFCLQDETNPGNFVLINASTGEYSFFCNGVLIASGRGTLNAKGCEGTIEHNKGDRRVLIVWDTTANGGKGAGTAIVQLGPNNTRCQITDKNMSNNTCAPAMGPVVVPGRDRQP